MANQNFIPGVTGWTGMSFMPNPTTHAAAAAQLVPQTTTANNVGGQVPVPNTNTQGTATPPQALNDPSLGSNPGAAGNGAGLSPVLTATPYGTNNLPAFLNQGLNQLNSNFGNQQQWFDLISKILGTVGGQQQVDPETDLLKTRIMAESANGGPANANANAQYGKAADLASHSTGAFSWSNPAWQAQTNGQFYQSLAHDSKPNNVTWNTGNQAGTYRPPSGASGWGPSMPSY